MGSVDGNLVKKFSGLTLNQFNFKNIFKNYRNDYINQHNCIEYYQNML